MAVNTSKGLGRFEGFELHLRAGEVRKDGAKPVRLPEQPFQILTMLLKHPGKVVTREEIRKRLWPNDTIVEFEHSISAAMNRLRQALGDSAESPRFVETVPRRGYRFIAPVEGIGLAGAGLSPSRVQETPLGPAGREGETTEPAPRKRWPLAIGAVLGLLAVAALGWYVWQRRSPRPELIQRQLTTNSSELAVTASAISPDGRYLAYADENGVHLKVIDNAEIHDLPTPAGSRVNSLAWFPEGNKLLASGEAGEPSVFSLWTISILGGAPQKLRDDAWDGNVFQDGTGIVFLAARARKSGKWVLRERMRGNSLPHGRGSLSQCPWWQRVGFGTKTLWKRPHRLTSVQDRVARAEGWTAH